MKKLYFCVGTNASGKSSLAKHLLRTEPNPQIIRFEKQKNEVSVLPSQNMILMGRYRSDVHCGGCDTISPKANTLAMFRSIWTREEDIYAEGFLLDSMKWLREIDEINMSNGNCREIVIVNFNTTLETCFVRLLKRSGKTRDMLKNNGQNVVNGWNNVVQFIERSKINHPHFRFITLDSEHLPVDILCSQLLGKELPF